MEVFNDRSCETLLRFHQGEDLSYAVQHIFGVLPYLCNENSGSIKRNF